MVTLLLKFIMLLGCPLVLYCISIRNEVLVDYDNDKGEPLEPASQQAPQEQFTSDADLLLDDDFDINSLINAEEDI